MKNGKSSLILNTLLIILGNVLYAATVVFFIIPGDIITCGTTGISLFISSFTNIDVSYLIFGINSVLFIIGFLVLGKKFAISTALSTVIYPLSLNLITRFAGDFVITDNRMLCVIFAGILAGVAIAITLRAGASTGGTDIPAIILSKYAHIPLSIALWILDIAVLIVQIPANKPEAVLFGILMIIIYAIAADRVLIAGVSQTEVKVISHAADRIAEEIRLQADRGVTLLNGKTGHLGKDTQVVLSVFSNRELSKIEKIILDIDPAAFIIVSRVTEVTGRGFTRSREYISEKTE